MKENNIEAMSQKLHEYSYQGESKIYNCLSSMHALDGTSSQAYSHM